MIVISLTRSQQMALLSLLSEYMRKPNATEQFIDCSVDPTVCTTPGDLLTLVMEAVDDARV